VTDDAWLDEWLKDAVDADEAAQLTAQFVAIRSYPGEEGDVQREIARWLDANGLPVRVQPTDGDRPNVIATLENGDGPTLLLNGHVDTVLRADGWSSDPWTPRRDGERLYGLGACDMKAGIAAALLATRALARRTDLWRGRLIFSAVVDEEAFSIGARALLGDLGQVDACVVTESAFVRPALGSVGKVLIRAEVSGKAAHASWPDDGVNAAIEAARFAVQLRSAKLGDHPRLRASQTVLSLQSGSDQYVMTIPERATIVINRHTVPGESSASILTQLEGIVAGLASPATFTFQIDPPFYPPWETPISHPFVTRFSAAYARETGHAPVFGYSGFGDANLFAGELGIPTVHFGPHGGNFHQADEWVDIPSISTTIRILLRLAVATLN